MIVKHVINLDWLELMCSGSLVATFKPEIETAEGEGQLIGGKEIDSPLEKYEFDQGRIVLAKKMLGTKIFKYSYEMYFAGKLFGKVHCCPRSPEVLKPDLIQFQIENNVLYEVGALNDVKYVLKKMCWEVVNITRVDIALDGVKVLQMIDSFRKDQIIKLGKAKVHSYTTGKNILEGFDVGSRSSNKWITGYNKSEELEVSNKGYIKKYWENCGLDTSEDIERLELKLRNEEIKKISDFDWKELDNFEYLASLFRSCMKNFFEFVALEESKLHTNTTRMKRIEFIDWDAIGAKLLPRMSTQQVNEVYRVKQAVKTNYWYYLASGQKYYADIAQEMAMNINAIEWYAGKLKRFQEEFEKRSGHNKDGLIKFQYMLHFTQYDANLQLKLFEK